MNWQAYQQKVSDFFQSIGGITSVDTPLKGVRGNHKIDVLVTIKHFGVNLTWVVECKLWKTSVPKEKILTLQQIVQDVGADRGFLMSESGFQAGAIKCAQTSNVTLSSLSELQEMATEELLNLKLKAVSVKLEELTRRYYKFIPWPKYSKIKYVELAVEYLPNLYMIRLEIPKALNGNFPVRLLSKTILNLPDFLKECEEVFRVCTFEIEKVEKQYDENYRIGYPWLETWHSLINQLVSITRQIVDQTGDDSRQDKTRIKAAGIMKKIGNVTDKLSGCIAGDLEHSFATINKWLIDGLYLDLLNVNLQHEDLTRTNEGLQKALSDFARDFQPINSPPVPKMSSW
jgi:hypothetical protein